MQRATTVLCIKNKKKYTSLGCIFMYVRTYYYLIIATNKPINQWRETYPWCGVGWSTDSADRVYIYIYRYVELVSVGRALTTNTRPPPLPTECVFFRPLFGALTAIFSLFRRLRCCQRVLTQFLPIFGPFPDVPGDQRTEETKNRIRIDTTRLDCRRIILTTRWV